jgi:biotin-(acetyl-CoA carboxylase) ligase
LKIDSNTEHYKTPIGFLYNSKDRFSDSEFIDDFVDYFQNNRISFDEISKLWDQYCLHKDKFVKIADDKNEANGVFKTIGQTGEAIIENDGLHNIISGSLFILE